MMTHSNCHRQTGLLFGRWLVALVRNLSLLGCGALAAFVVPAAAAPSDLDPTFGGSGNVITPNGGNETAIHSIALQRDGKIVVAGQSTSGANQNFIVGRYNTDGSLDSTFGTGGFVTTDFGGRDRAERVVLQDDAKIVVAGYSEKTNSDFVVARYNADGILDASFGGTGMVATDFDNSGDLARDATIQPDGKIVVAGSSAKDGIVGAAVVRYGVDGSLDTTFNGTGKVKITSGGELRFHARCMALQDDGGIILGGGSEHASTNYDKLLLMRISSVGNLDPEFAGAGVMITDFGGEGWANRMTLSNGKILVAGHVDISDSSSEFALARFDAGGIPDASFNGTGKVVIPIGSGYDYATDIVVQTDGRILVTGVAEVGGKQEFALVRCDTDGSLDPSFNGTGKLITVVSPGGNAPTAIALQSDGKILVTGTSNLYSPESSIALLRYIGGGPPPAPEIEVEQQGGSVVVSGGTAEFGTWLIGNETSLSFTIKNTGKADLAGLSTSIDGANFGEYLVTASPAASVGQNANTVFTVQFTPSSNGLRTGVLHIASNDADENPFDIILTGTGTDIPADISVEQPLGTALSDGSERGIGTVAIGSAASLTFTVKNTGMAPLLGLAVTHDGADASMFTVTRSPSPSVSQNAGTTFTVRFSPTSTGTKTARLHIASNDADENPFDVVLTGTATGMTAPGDPDLTFGNAGVVPGNYTTVAVQSDGKIIAAGNTSVARFHENGTPDTSFGGTGSVQSPIGISGADRSIALQPDGKIVAVGSVGTNNGDVAVVRFNANGTADSGFGSAGTGIVSNNITMGGYRSGTEYVYVPSRDVGVSVAVLTNGDIVAVGTANYYLDSSVRDFYPVAMGIIRYNADGSGGGVTVVGLSNGYYPAPVASGGAATSVIAAPDGGYVTSAWTIYGGTVIKRYPASGSPPQSFGGNLMQSYPYEFPDHDECYAIALTAAGGIVATGTAQVVDYSQHYPSLGQRTSSLVVYGPGSFVRLGQGSGNSVAVQSDGRIVVAGGTLMRFNADGSIDAGFPSVTGGNSVAMQNDGKILVAGNGLRRYGGTAPFAEIAVEQPVGVSLTDGAANVSFGSAFPGSPVSRTFTIRNSSVSNLTLLGTTIDGPSAVQFAVTTAPEPMVPGGGTTTFVVTYNPAVVGPAVAVLHIANRDPDENPFDITLTGIGLGPEIAVEYPTGTGIADNSLLMDFGPVVEGNTSSSRTITIRNAGTGDLTGLAVSKSAAGAPEDFSIGALGATTLTPGASTTFSVTFSPTAPGTRTATLSIASNDGDENPFEIALTGTGIEILPEIAVESPSGNNLTDGAQLPDVGTIPHGATSTRTITIRSVGTGDLTGLAVTKSTAGSPGDFTIGALSVTTLAPNVSTSFDVTFSPTGPGIRTTTLLIGSNDADENPFEITLTGRQANPSEQWRSTYFGSIANTGPGADLSDPDRDGLVNLVEFATRSDPLVWTPSPGELVKNGTTLELTYTRAKAALTELTLRFEWTESLSGPWNTVGGTNVTVLSDDGVTQVVRSTLPAGPAGKRFLRLRVTRPPG